MDASEFKNYILKVIFYDICLRENRNVVDANVLKMMGITYEEAFTDEEFRPVVEEWSLSKSAM